VLLKQGFPKEIALYISKYLAVDVGSTRIGVLRANFTELLRSFKE